MVILRKVQIRSEVLFFSKKLENSRKIFI